MKKSNWLLVAILVLAAALRLWRIGQAPHGFNADEAAIGYNAYSLLKTGRDEHGNSWPLHFESFADYKPGGYFYLALPFIAFLGLEKIAVRLPSIIAGIASVWLVYKLTGELFKKQRKVLGLGVSELAAIALALSPWQIQFSRGGWKLMLQLLF